MGLKCLKTDDMPHYGSMAWDRWYREKCEEYMKTYPTTLDRLKHQMYCEELANSVLFNRPFATIEIYKSDAELIIKMLEANKPPDNSEAK